MFVVKVSDMQVTVAPVDPEKLDFDLDESNVNCKKLPNTNVAYITGPLYFGTCNKLAEKLVPQDESYILILSMRGVPLADISGIQALQELCESLVSQGIMVYFSCVQPPVMEMIERIGMKERFKDSLFFWSTDQVLHHICNQ